VESARGASAEFAEKVHAALIRNLQREADASGCGRAPCLASVHGMSSIRIPVATLEVCVRCSRCFTAPLGTPVRPSWRRRWWRRRGRRRGRRRRASRAVTAQRRQRGADVDPVDRQATERHGIQLKTERWLLRGAVDRVRHLEGCWRRGHHASCIGQRHICSGAVEAGDPRILVAAQAPSVRGIEKPGGCKS